MYDFILTIKPVSTLGKSVIFEPSVTPLHCKFPSCNCLNKKKIHNITPSNYFIKTYPIQTIQVCVILS